MGQQVKRLVAGTTQDLPITIHPLTAPLQLGFFLILVLLVSVFWSVPVRAQMPKDMQSDRASRCFLKIDGVIYDTGSCAMNDEDEGVIRFGQLDESPQSGYWVHIQKNDDGSFDASWNAEYGARHAHVSIGEVTYSKQGTADCWSNTHAMLCRNVLEHEPLYDIGYYPEREPSRVLLAYVDGVEHEIVHPAWDVLYPLQLAERLQLDGHEGMEQIVLLTHGGNCCPPSLSVVSYRGDGFFSFLDPEPIDGGWDGYDILLEGGRTVIRVKHSPYGYGNDQTQRSQDDYVVVDGALRLVTERIETSRAASVARLNLVDVIQAEGKRDTLAFDINNDGTTDTVACTYWERWGVLNCEAQISGVSEPISMQCKDVSISRFVSGLNRQHQLLCDREIVEY
ncbi:hypothetical protein [Yoonia vestfoldensis]|uniref:Uncharacterized protein n=1 Tax=Yoonia vestfoldensis SKA53 TaxID=314232 RepID=A3V5V3_9RHOB|nr:hypothetical protein [Yoonia vestfoldensis]EAQ06277.1 hypothetical protein SKA53_04298 [Yoonia vestfoldensis SKA53]